jgi:hypothetical protein
MAAFRAATHTFASVVSPHEAAGAVYPEADRFLIGVRSAVEEERRVREQRRQTVQPSRMPSSTELKSIDSFRADPKYGGDGTRIDLAYAIYAASHGAGAAQIEAAIRSRDLSHKGREDRQAHYVERTIKKAFESARTQSRGR